MASSNQSRLKEAMSAGGSSSSKGPHEPDGELTDCTASACEMRGSDGASMHDNQPSSSYLEPAKGDHPSSLYGKYTWRVPKFSDTSKRELRSKSFTVGDYRFYILVYPNGCDVCNHLSLFLCVADYDNLLPGWSHFAQFTIAVVNKDPKKSKYSDTLHRFCKKEHDWGWKRFMEISKVVEGFTMEDTLTIKAQVQVIRDRSSAPFRCLDSGYRRELLRVYASNVDSICVRFVEERRAQLQVLLGHLPAFRSFWAALSEVKRASLVTQRSEVVLKGIVKRFFNEKEVTSTLVMDALFSGCQQIEAPTLAAPSALRAGGAAPVIADSERGVFSLQGDLLELLQGAAAQPALPPISDQVPLTPRSDAADGSAAVLGAARDERRLAALGRRTVEVYVVSHLFLEHLAAAFWEVECVRRQEALILAEEAHFTQLDVRTQAKAAADKERKLRKKAKRKAKQETEQQQQPDAPEITGAAQSWGNTNDRAHSQAAPVAAAAPSATDPCAQDAEGNGNANGSSVNTTDSQQVRQLQRQVAVMAARITQQDDQIAALGGQLIALKAGQPEAAVGAAPAAERSCPHCVPALTPAGSDSSHGRCLGAPTVCSNFTGRSPQGSSAGSAHGSAAAAVPRPATPVAAVDGSSRIVKPDSRDDSRSGSSSLSQDDTSSSRGTSRSSRAASPSPPDGTAAACTATATLLSSLVTAGPSPADTGVSDDSSSSSLASSGGAWQPAGRMRMGGRTGGKGGRGATTCTPPATTQRAAPAVRNGSGGGSNGLPATSNVSGGCRVAAVDGRPSTPQSALNSNASSFVPSAPGRAVDRRTSLRGNKATESAQKGGYVRVEAPAPPPAPIQAPAPTQAAQSYRAAAAAGRLGGADAACYRGERHTPQLPPAAIPVANSDGDFRFLLPARSAVLPSAVCGHDTGSPSPVEAAVLRSNSTGALAFAAATPQGHPGDSCPVLDGFAHMGLITDLLE